ncbi:RND superfamily putative drug exporter [Streptomyces sp. DSM 41037]|uniref:MMPL family transporter n=1 Tax=Streptomyces sp. DSM 41037 TaxID=2817710 RepID=UPI002786F971|nr:MMPL family transporter [Streptomyces sp. DSM 41037]MDQ0297375.1 RND superfamily putative drug exporter [Streptomyces sp. DSM 41037]
MQPTNSRLLRCLLGSRKRAAVVVAFWILIAGLLAGVAPTLESVEDNASANLPPAASDSMKARDLVRAQLPGQDATPAIVVVRGEGADAAASAQQAVTRITAALSESTRPDQVASVISTVSAPDAAAELVSRDRSAQLLVVPMTGSPSDESFQNAVDKVRSLVSDRAGPTEVAVTGPAGIATDTVKVFSGGDRILLAATILLVLVILLAIYRSPLMALVPLVAVGVAMRVAETVGALLADAGLITVSSQTASIMTVLLFGVGTDYALIITVRYREALLDEPDRARAMRTAVHRTAESVLASASTIVLAMFALLVAASPALRGFGPYLALGVAVMALVAFTLIPALVLLLGRGVFWPGGVDKAAERGRGAGVWHRVAALVAKAPVRVASAVVALLVVLSAGLLGYQESFNTLSGFRTATESERGQHLIQEEFGPGEIAPSTVVVRSHEDLRSGSAPAEIAAGIADAGHVSRVGEHPRFAEDGTTVFYDVVLDLDPYSSEALDAIAPLQEAARTAADAAGVQDATVLVGGETAQNADIRSALDHDTTLIALLVLAIVTAVLALLLRSVLAPLYLVATLVLSFLATLGVTTFFTVTVLGDEGIGNRVTAYIFIFLIALGVDYNIFIMSRFKQELRTRPPAAAVTAALTRTGGVVSSAGLILAATFAVLMTQPIRELFQFGFAMAFGILLDTFLIRPLLVPALVRLLGDRALWPSRPGTPQTPSAPRTEPPAADAPAARGPEGGSGRLLRAFTWIAVVEACTWAGLLVGMYFKYVPETTELGVRIFGTLHGAAFVVYVLLTVLVAVRLKWRLGRTTILALLAAIPPFMTIAFEVWARRTGRLPGRAVTANARTVPSSR